MCYELFRGASWRVADPECASVRCTVYSNPYSVIDSSRVEAA